MRQSIGGMMLKDQLLGRKELWTKPFIITVIINFLAYTSTYIIMATIPLFVLHVGGSRFMAGVITGVFSFTGFLVRPLFGNLLDHKGRKTILHIGNIVLLLVIIGYSIFPYILILFILRILQSIGWSALSTATNTIASDLIPPSRRFEGIGYFGISLSIAMAIGPALGLYIVEYYNYTILYAATALLIILTFFLGLFLKYDDKASPEKNMNAFSNTDKIKKINNKPLIYEKTAIPPSSIFFLVAITYSSIVTFVPLYAVSLGLKNIGLFFVMYALALLFTRPTAGQIADRIGPTKVILTGLVFLLIALLILSEAASLQMFLIAGALYGFGYGCIHPVLNALVIDFAPPERRGAANATFLAANDIGLALGTIIWGLISQNIGFVYLYLFSPVLIVLSMIVYLLVVRHKITKI